MCTLIVFKGMHPRYPLIVCANRDERPTRPTQDPTELPGGIYAPLDLVHGGTWIGVNRHGLVASLTNRFIAPRFRGRRSRGLIVTEALQAEDSCQAVAALMKQPPDTYNGFQLFIDDGRDAAIVWGDARQIQGRWLDSGTWIFTGDDDEPGKSKRQEAVMDRLRAGTRFEDLCWLTTLLSFHGSEPGEGTCVHGPGISMESIFSMIIRRPVGGQPLEILWRAQRPCEEGEWVFMDMPIDRK